MSLRWQRRLRATLGWLAAAVTAAVIGTLMQTQLNLAALAELGVDIPLGVRIETSLADLVGFAPTYTLIVGVGFLIALPIASWIGRRRPAARRWLLILAAAIAVATTLMVMRQVLGLTAIAAARTVFGFLLMVASGALGGWVFGRLTARAHTNRA